MIRIPQTLKNNDMKKIILLSAIIFCCLKMVAQPGKFDSSFGVNGIVKAGFGQVADCDFSTQGKQVLLASDGSIFIVADVNGQTIIAKKISDGSTDVTYGDHGFSTPLDITNAHAALQKDNKIVVAGTALARLKTDGTPDSTYGIDGIQALDFYIETVAIQPDEKIVVAGRSSTIDFEVARYTTDGILDSSFSQDGKQITDFRTGSFHNVSFAKSAAIASDGKIILLGYTGTNNGDKVCLARYNSDGTLDNSFDADGKLITDIVSSSYYGFSLAIQPDAKLVIATSFEVSIYSTAGPYSPGSYFLVARYESDGLPDLTFGNNGKQITDAGPFNDSPSSIVIQNNGKIVVTGTSARSDTAYFVTVRYDHNGILDNAFNNDGTQTTIFTSRVSATSVAIQPDDKILIAGYSINPVGFAVARYESDGTPDVTFDSDGKLTGTYCTYVGSTFFSCAAIQSDGKLLVGGTVLARYKNDGSLDNTFNGTGYQIIDYDISSIAIQKDGKIVAGGSALARYNIDGSPDNSFSPGGKITIDYSIVSMAIQSDGKIVVGGIDYHTGISILTRYNTDGNLDNSFSGDGKQTVDFIITSMALQSDGKIIVGGEALARYNTDGNLDNTFGGDGILSTQYGHAYSIAIQSDDKIVVAGHTFSPDGAGNFTLERYNIDGSLDVTGIANFGDYQQTGPVTVSSIGIQNNGNIVIGGSVAENSALAWFGPDGSLYGTFTIAISHGVDAIQGIAIKNNRLYTVGYGEFPGDLGIVTSILLDGENENTGPGVTSFTLVNATTDDDIQSIPDGSTLDINTLPRYVNIRANTNPNKVGSVVFILDGKKVRTENGAPYALAGDNPSGDYHNWTLPLGDHTLTAIPYSKYNGKGTEGTALTIHFTVVGQRVESFTLINAETDKSIQSIPNGAIIDLSKLPTQQLNIRANTNPGKVGSVVFILDGKKVRIENGAPYALAGDNPAGDYHNWTLPLGDHTLTAIPYSNYNGKGAEGTALTIHFTVVGQRVESFTLINAETDKGIQSIVDGAVIDLSKLPAHQLNIRANTNPGKVGSVVFILDGEKVRTENGAPYALAGDNPSGDYHAWALPLGDHTLTAIPYSNYNGKGTEGVSLTIHFTVVNNPGNLITSADGLNIPRDVMDFSLYPNPVNKILNINIGDIQPNGKSTVSIINSSGAVVRTIQVNGRNNIVQLNVSSLAPGTYFIKIINGDKVMNKRFVKL